jgi:1-acyl-sn-glycerol-3-phosphate acyltransferase
MKLKRKSLSFFSARIFTNFYIQNKYHVSISGIENMPKSNSGLLLVKQQYHKDIFLEGYVLDKYCNRSANWVMMNPLPKFLEKFGGIKITRVKELRNHKNKYKRKRFLEKAKEINEDSSKYINWLYTQGELVVLHPEAIRNPGKVGKIYTFLIEKAIEFQKKMFLNIPIIPIGIHYEDVRKRYSEVYFNIGNPINIHKPNLENQIAEELKILSHLK